MLATITRTEYLKLTGINDGEMRLSEVRTRYASRACEELEGRFTGSRTEPEFPDFYFRITFTPEDSPEHVRNTLAAWLEGRKLMHRGAGVQSLGTSQNEKKGHYSSL